VTAANKKADAPTAPSPPAGLTLFLGAVFVPDDQVLIRPVETWTNGDKKESRTVYRETIHVAAGRLARDGKCWQAVTRAAERERANLFFGVCPRHQGAADGGEYNFAWQIRTVRVLWADLDHRMPEEALRRCKDAGLPAPSVVIRSGNGVHLYWLLAEPYLIDDAGDPPPVFTEFVGQGDGKRKLRRRFIRDAEGRRVYQYLADPKTGGDSKKRNPDFPSGLGDKARRIQRIIAAVAAKVGGDHTQDLARLLRLPCTLNRKDERNGRPPVPCELVECDPVRRHPLADFERFADAAPAAAERAAANVRLPSGVKLTARRRNRLNDFINASSLAEDRSKADFDLCCFAVREGLDKEAVWAEVQDVGKFEERGRDYFDLTWENAGKAVRLDIHRRLCGESCEADPCLKGAAPSLNGADTVGKAACAPAAPPDGTPAAHGPADAGDPEPGPPPSLPAPEGADDPHRLARLFVADHITADGPKLRWWRDEFHRWDGQADRVLPDKEVKAELAQCVKREFDRVARNALRAWEANGKKGPAPVARKVTVRLVGDALQALQGTTMLPGAVEQPAWLGLAPMPFAAGEVLACRNTLVHLPSWAAGAPHRARLTPALFSANNVGYDFAPDAPDPLAWLEFLESIWGDDRQPVDTLQEWFGYCLLPDTRQHKILMIVGPKRSGKGTIARILRALIGVHNTASPTLAGLGTNFGLSPLLGKTLAVISDARLSGRTDAAVVVERLLSISGEDAQTIDRKHKAPVTTTLPTRFMVLTNELPRLNDPSGALAARLVLLRQTRSFYGAEDTGLTGRLLAELPGILLWAMKGWKRLRERGRFEQPESGKGLVAEMEDLSSPIGAFVRECCEVGPAFQVFMDDLYQRFKSWCKAQGRKDVPIKQVFGRDLRAALPHLDERQPRLPGGERARVYTGLRLRESADPVQPPWGG
jgi:putative DNA primase/helicase